MPVLWHNYACVAVWRVYFVFIVHLWLGDCQSVEKVTVQRMPLYMVIDHLDKVLTHTF